MNVIRVGNQTIGDDSLFFVVEEGNYNLGDFRKAINMVHLASECGASAIEFQFFVASDFYTSKNPGFEKYKAREFSTSQINELIITAKSKNIELIACSLSPSLINELSEMGCSAFTINGGDINNPEILDAVANTRKTIFLSLCLADEMEIDWAINRLINKNAKNIVLMHGQHIMASKREAIPLEQTQLGCIKSLEEKYSLYVGFIDHTPYDWMPLCAVSAGAPVVTKHLTFSKKIKGPDWFICLDPMEMEKAIKMANKTFISYKTIEKTLIPGEEEDRLIMRRSIYASHNIKAGSVLTSLDIRFKRPYTGINANDYHLFVGKMLKKDILIDEPIGISDILDSN
jgi:sialic acid synthase SpsE|tara:strand:+ start:478 stop:1506 length:1029 start_codon:yes stop_codon:yes gene_type:complete